MMESVLVLLHIGGGLIGWRLGTWIVSRIERWLKARKAADVFRESQRAANDTLKTAAKLEQAMKSPRPNIDLIHTLTEKLTTETAVAKRIAERAKELQP
ncbi:MAG: hypothetical protein AAGA36_00340 [Pseudomonadota bacterium]